MTTHGNHCGQQYQRLQNAADSSSSVAVRLNHYAQGDAHAVVQAWSAQHSVSAGEVALSEYGM